LESLKSSPKVLFFIPLYNARPYIRQAIESILNQTFQDFTLLIIDDGSTDGGGDIVRQFSDKRIIYQTQSNAGVAAAMNRALEFALQNRYEFLARMDADDISLPDRLEKEIPLLQKHTDVAVCGTNSYYMDAKTEEIIGSSTVPCSSWLIKWEIRQGLRGIIQSAAVFRSSALQTIGGFRSQFIISEDTDVFLRLSEQFNFINSTEYLHKSRLRENSLSTQNLRQAILFQLYALDCAKKRKTNRSDISFQEFGRDQNLWLRFSIWRDEQILSTWRKEMGKINYYAIFLSLCFDQRRILARTLRILDKKYHSFMA
jgi:glycosyltransferase involved in cell wall biosynthesis